MAFLKKQLNKANQFLNEKTSGMEGTKLDQEYIAMEKRVELTSGLVENLQSKTKDYLEINTNSFGIGRSKTTQPPVGVLGDCMLNYGRKFEDNQNGNGKILGQVLNDTGNEMRRLADAKSILIDNVKDKFLKPLNDLQTRDLKDIEHQRDKVMSRRLDYDRKRTKQQQQGQGAPPSVLSEAEIKMAAGKFAESYQLAQIGMNNLIEKDSETVHNIIAMTQSLYEYHVQCADILKNLCQTLEAKSYALDTIPKNNFTPKKLKELENILGIGDSSSLPDSGTNSPRTPPPYTYTPSVSQAQPPRPPSLYVPTPAPYCQALYDFEPQLPNELQIRTGETIQLVRKVDQDWFEGTVGGRRGLFPSNYVHVIIPLP